MTLDASVTAGHPLYCVHRFRDQVRHMVIFDRYNKAGSRERTRLFLTDGEYEDLRKQRRGSSAKTQAAALSCGKKTGSSPPRKRN